MMKVVAFGEILFDIIEDEPFLGGAPLNFAAHLTRLGVEAFIYSRVGDDPLGEKALEKIAGLGVNTHLVQLDPVHPTGTVNVALNEGQPSYTIIEEVAYDYIEPLQHGQKNSVQFDILYYGTLAQRNSVSRNTLVKLMRETKFKHVFFDVNLRQNFYNLEVLKYSLDNCSILKLNDEEVEILGELIFDEKLSMEDFCLKAAEEFDIDMVVITAGPKGCMVYHGGKLKMVKGYPARVVDTVGAGDSFSAAFLFHYLQSNDPECAADVANRVGAFVASSRGPIPEYTEEIKQVLGLV